ncbi:hypothetical protein D3C86_2033280 [compost metagenome]
MLADPLQFDPVDHCRYSLDFTGQLLPQLCQQCLQRFRQRLQSDLQLILGSLGAQGLLQCICRLGDGVGTDGC